MYPRGRICVNHRFRFHIDSQFNRLRRLAKPTPPLLRQRFARPRKPPSRRAALAASRAGDRAAPCKHGRRHPCPCDAQHRRRFRRTRKPASRDTKPACGRSRKAPRLRLARSPRPTTYWENGHTELSRNNKDASFFVQAAKRPFSCPAGTAGFRVRRGGGSPEWGWASARRRAGNLFTGAPPGRCHRPLETAPRRAGFRG